MNTENKEGNVQRVGEHTNEQDATCPACDDGLPMIRFDGKTLWLHCNACGSDTAGDALLAANACISDERSSMAEKLRGIEFASSGYCPACGGWGADPGRGCTPRAHTKTCWIAEVLK